MSQRTMSETSSGAAPVSRRTVLRGVGVSLALPWLESVGGARSVARAAGSAVASSPPVRMAFIFTPNGVNYHNWRPTAGPEGAFTLSPTLEPLARIRSEINVMTGLTLDKARANGDGPGDHARSSATFLTGRQARKTAGNDIRIGVSVDQFAAQQVGRRTRLPSIELGCEHGSPAGNCDSGYSCAYTSNIAWRDEDTPVPKIIDPAIAFERMFGSSERTAGQRDHLRRRASILDYVLQDSRRLESRLGASDRRKLDEFQQSVREIERRVQHAMRESDADPKPERNAPAGIPRKLSAHIDLMYDMLLLAFQTDVTRVGTLMIGRGGSNRSIPEIGVNEGHHELSHHQGNAEMIEKIRRIDRYYTERFALFLERMAATPEGEGSLLDGCMIMYGSGISDGNHHNHSDLPIVLAGRAGGAIDPGRLIEHPPETPLCGLYMSMLRAMGCQVESFGDASSPLSGLRV